MLDNGMIRYLVKFVGKEEHADSLLRGELYMHSVDYYIDLEYKNGPGQGDSREGLVFPGIPMHENIHFPVYCMYMIKDTDISDGRLHIERRIIDEFCGLDGFFVIVDFVAFENALRTTDTEGYSMIGREVSYEGHSIDRAESIFNNKDALNLFVKSPQFSYQKEYRLIVHKNLQMSCNSSSSDPTQYTFKLAGPITGFAKKVAVLCLLLFLKQINPVSLT